MHATGDMVHAAAGIRDLGSDRFLEGQPPHFHEALLTAIKSAETIGCCASMVAVAAVMEHLWLLFVAGEPTESPVISGGCPSLHKI